MNVLIKETGFAKSMLKNGNKRSSKTIKRTSELSAEDPYIYDEIRQFNQDSLLRSDGSFN